MRDNIVTIFSIAFLCLFIAADATASQKMFQPKPGEGPVQMAERLRVDPAAFIAANRSRFVNPKRPSLIYTWQKFVLPETKRNINAKKNCEGK